MKQPFHPALLTVAGVLALTGCHRVTFINGPDAAKQPAYEDRLNSAFAGDVVDIDAPEKLDFRCPEGWSRLELKRSVYTGLLEFWAGWVYSARSATLYCAPEGASVGETPAAPAPPPAEPAAPPAAAPPAPEAAPPTPMDI